MPNLSSGFHSPQPAPAVGGTDAVIDRFSGDFGFLSNFYEASLWYRGKQYRSVEHAYQACKASDESTHETIRNARNASVAKRLGKAVALPADWEDRKLGLMRELVHEKFKNPLLQALLLATEDVPLVEGNTWNDTFWGVCRGRGTNWLGLLLMEERERCKRDQALV